MTNLTFATSPSPTIIIHRCGENVEIEGWEEERVQVHTDSEPHVDYNPGRVLIQDCDAAIRLRVPRGATIQSKHVEGDLRVSRVESLRAGHIDGDATLTDISGHCRAGQIEGEARVERAGSLETGHINGDATITGTSGPCRVGQIEGDLRLRGVSDFTVRHVNGDAHLAGSGTCNAEQIEGEVQARDLAALVVGHVNGDLDVANVSGRCAVRQVEGDAQVRDIADLAIEHVNGDLRASGIRERCVIGQLEGDATLRDVADLHLRAVNGDLELDGVGGRLSLEHVNGDARLRGRFAGFGPVRIEGDLDLQTVFPPNERYELVVQGDATVHVPEGSDLTLEGRVQGDVSGVGEKQPDGTVRAVWSDGSARLRLEVEGDLSVRSVGATPAAPAVSSCRPPGRKLGSCRPATPAVPSAPVPPFAGPERQQRSGADRDMAVLEAVARGELSPEEAEALLEAQGQR
jgi:DUF4097 and DUF4098 domain-containing protein YvlB